MSVVRPLESCFGHGFEPVALKLLCWFLGEYLKTKRLENRSFVGQSHGEKSVGWGTSAVRMLESVPTKLNVNVPCCG